MVLSCFDPLMGIMVFVCAAPFVVPLIALVGRLQVPVAAILAGSLLFGLATARARVVVTREGALGQRTLFGIPYWMVDLGRHPAIEHGLVWSWSEVAVVPRPEYRTWKLHDGDRFVMADYYHDDDERYDEILGCARRAVSELHGSGQDGSV